MQKAGSNIRNYLRRQSFQPGLLGILFNPFYFIRKDLYKSIRQYAPQLQGKLLDFGCGRKPYRNLFTVDEYIGVDIEVTGHNHGLSEIDVYYDGKTIPFADGTFDTVFCSEVFEHLFNLNEILPELRRVLKDGGTMLVTVPFCWNEHEVPYDFGRYTSFGIKHVMEKEGFEVLAFRKSGHFARVNFQLIALYWYSLFTTKSKLFNYICSMLLIVPVNVIGSLLLLVLPKNNSLYFNNVLLVKKIQK
jgi:SAM-dependent methyltransferase